MFGKVPPIAEPGAPRYVLFYAFWIPVGWGIGALSGLVMGLVYACLLVVMDLFSAEEEATSFMRKYGWRLLCGAAAGGAIGFAAIRRPEGLYVALAGVISAAVSGYLNQRRTS